MTSFVFMEIESQEDVYPFLDTLRVTQTLMLHKKIFKIIKNWTRYIGFLAF